MAAGVTEVVYALADPNAVAAGGAARLRAAGVTVRNGVCGEEAAELNRHWLHAQRIGRPHVTAKFAMSLDGRIATRTGSSKWITGAPARERAHALRKSVDAIIVGAGTVIADDPSLTARPTPGKIFYPLRVVLDSGGRTPPGAAVYDRVGKGALLVATRAAAPSRLETYHRHGVETLVLDANESGRPDVADLLAALKVRGSTSVLVEGGGEVLGAFFDAGLVDEVWAFIAPIVIGGGTPAIAGAGAAAISEALALANVETETLGRDLLVRGRVRRGAA